MTVFVPTDEVFTRDGFGASLPHYFSIHPKLASKAVANHIVENLDGAQLQSILDSSEKKFETESIGFSPLILTKDGE